jgi:CubicO group peptidase (beta-lactamase class C family)
VQQEFLTPLGLNETYYCNVEPLIPHRAQGYTVKEGKFVNSDYLDMDLPFAAGSICSTPADLVRWSQALQAGKVVSAASYHQMSTPAALNDGKLPKAGYGFGLMISDLGGHRQVAHGGGINGFVASLATFPDDSLYVVVLTNVSGENARQMLTLAQALSRFALGLPPAPVPAPAPQKPPTPAPATRR